MIHWLCALLSSSPAFGGEWRGLDLAEQAELRSEARVALVIGNAAYARGELANPVRDAAAMAARLEELGFDVQLEQDLDYKHLVHAIRKFGKRLARGGTGLFYFAGHGIQVGGENYLIPVDAEIDEAEHVEAEAVTVNMVLGRMEGAENRLNILVLDACRNNPYERGWRSAGSGGLSAMDAPSGTLIAFATAPGTVASDGQSGQHGLYTEALLAHVGREGLDLEDTFKEVRAQVSDRTEGAQVPQEYTSVRGDFFFRIPAEGSDAAAPVVGAPIAGASDASVAVAVEDDGRTHWGFAFGSPFARGYAEGALVNNFGRQGIGLFVGPALSFARTTDHGVNLGTEDPFIGSVVSGLYVYERANLAPWAGLSFQLAFTQPLLFVNGRTPDVVPGVGLGASLDFAVANGVRLDIGSIFTVDNDPWWIPTLGLGVVY